MANRSWASRGTQASDTPASDTPASDTPAWDNQTSDAPASDALTSQARTSRVRAPGVDVSSAGLSGAGSAGAGASGGRGSGVEEAGAAGGGPPATAAASDRSGSWGLTPALATALTWASALGVAIGAGVLAGAGQLGIGYGLGIVRWEREFSSADWHAQLTWVTFYAAVAVVFGTAAGSWRARRLRQPAGPLLRAALTLAAAAGAAVLVPLVMRPAGGSHLLWTGDPRTTAGIAAVAGLLLGVLAALAMLLPAVSGNVILCVFWVWIAAVASAIWTLGHGASWATARLGLLPAGGVWIPVLLLGVPALIALGVATVARFGGGSPRLVAPSGLAGPALVGAAYLIAGPGNGVQLTRYRYALTGIVVAVVVSTLVALVRRQPGLGLIPMSLLRRGKRDAAVDDAPSGEGTSTDALAVGGASTGGVSTGPEGSAADTVILGGAAPATTDYGWATVGTASGTDSDDTLGAHAARGGGVVRGLGSGATGTGGSGGASDGMDTARDQDERGGTGSRDTASGRRTGRWGDALTHPTEVTPSWEVPLAGTRPGAGLPADSLPTAGSSPSQDRPTIDWSATTGGGSASHRTPAAGFGAGVPSTDAPGASAPGAGAPGIGTLGASAAGASAAFGAGARAGAAEGDALGGAEDETTGAEPATGRRGLGGRLARFGRSGRRRGATPADHGSGAASEPAPGGHSTQTESTSSSTSLGGSPVAESSLGGNTFGGSAFGGSTRVGTDAAFGPDAAVGQGTPVSAAEDGTGQRDEPRPPSGTIAGRLGRFRRSSKADTGPIADPAATTATGKAGTYGVPGSDARRDSDAWQGSDTRQGSDKHRDSDTRQGSEARRNSEARQASEARHGGDAWHGGDDAWRGDSGRDGQPRRDRDEAPHGGEDDTPTKGGGFGFGRRLLGRRRGRDAAPPTVPPEPSEETDGKAAPAVTTGIGDAETSGTRIDAGPSGARPAAAWGDSAPSGMSSPGLSTSSPSTSSPSTSSPSTSSPVAAGQSTSRTSASRTSTSGVAPSGGAASGTSTSGRATFRGATPGTTAAGRRLPGGSLFGDAESDDLAFGEPTFGAGRRPGRNQPTGDGRTTGLSGTTSPGTTGGSGTPGQSGTPAGSGTAARPGSTTGRRGAFDVPSRDDVPSKDEVPSREGDAETGRTGRRGILAGRGTRTEPGKGSGTEPGKGAATGELPQSDVTTDKDSAGGAPTGKDAAGGRRDAGAGKGRGKRDQDDVDGTDAKEGKAGRSAREGRWGRRKSTAAPEPAPLKPEDDEYVDWVRGLAGGGPTIRVGGTDTARHARHPEPGTRSGQDPHAEPEA